MADGIIKIIIYRIKINYGREQIIVILESVTFISQEIF